MEASFLNEKNVSSVPYEAKKSNQQIAIYLSDLTFIYRLSPVRDITTIFFGLIFGIRGFNQVFIYCGVNDPPYQWVLTIPEAQSFSKACVCHETIGNIFQTTMLITSP